MEPGRELSERSYRVIRSNLGPRKISQHGMVKKERTPRSGVQNSSGFLPNLENREQAKERVTANDSDKAGAQRRGRPG